MENQIRMEFQQVIEEFYKQNDGVNGKGGVFMAVCRGKVSSWVKWSVIVIGW